MNLSTTTVQAFWGELEKIARYRTVREQLLDSDIPVIRTLPKDAEDAKKRIEQAISTVKSSTWTHPMVAIHESKVRLESLGFSPTKVAIPLPGESILTTSWRAGKLHAHKMGSFYLIHKDSHAVKGLSAIAHAFGDAPGALIKRVFGNPRIPVRAHHRQ